MILTKGQKIWVKLTSFYSKYVYVPLRELCFALTNSLKFKYLGLLLLEAFAMFPPPDGPPETPVFAKLLEFAA